MTLRHMNIFVHVCLTGSTTAAAEKLFLAQPAVSRAISELEKYYGIRLFDRIGKKLTMTDAGRRFFQYASHIANLFEELEYEVKNIDNIGLIRIGASITIGNCLLPQFICDFKKLFPQIIVKVFIENSDQIQQYILQNKIDIGLIEGLIHNDYFIRIPFREDELTLICAASHPLANKADICVEELGNLPFLLREPGSAGREIFDGTMAAHGLSIEPVWESVSTQAIIKAVRADLGISILPHMLVKESLEKGDLCSFALKDISFTRHFSVVYHKNKYLSKSAAQFIEICRSNGI